MSTSRYLLIGTLAASAAPPTLAHHSYAMFDASRTVAVTGTVAKVEWRNPHVYVWVYVRDPQRPDGYVLYAFENASINVLARLGWTKTSLTTGEKISVRFYPLVDGRAGGHFIEGTLADGKVLRGAGGPGVQGPLP